MNNNKWLKAQLTEICQTFKPSYHKRLTWPFKWTTIYEQLRDTSLLKEYIFL